MTTKPTVHALLLFLVVASLPLIAQEEVTAGPSQAMVVHDANLRDRAEISSRSIAVMPRGTIVSVVGAHGGWRRVRTGVRTGWIAGDLLDAINLSGFESIRAARETSRCTPEELDDCTETRCASTPEETLLHTRKRRRVSGRPVSVSMQDFLDLQDEAESVIGQGATVSDADLRKLRRLLRRGDGYLGEGKVVEFFGYVVGEPDASGAENVNCNLTGTLNVDFHINVADGPSRNAYKSIVVEMIPQDRAPEWTTRKLRKIERENLPVRIIGQLFYDNKHFIRDGRRENERSNQSKRHSLWEIHPITKFWVCSDGDCTPGTRAGWVALEDWDV